MLKGWIEETISRNTIGTKIYFLLFFAVLLIPNPCFAGKESIDYTEEEIRLYLGPFTSVETGSFSGPLPSGASAYFTFFRTFIQYTIELPAWHRFAGAEKDETLRNVVSFCSYFKKNSPQPLCEARIPLTVAILAQADLYMHADCCEILETLGNQSDKSSSLVQ